MENDISHNEGGCTSVASLSMYIGSPSSEGEYWSSSMGSVCKCPF